MFSEDEDTEVTRVEINFLKKKKKTLQVIQRTGHGLIELSKILKLFQHIVSSMDQKYQG